MGCARGFHQRIVEPPHGIGKELFGLGAARDGVAWRSAEERAHHVPHSVRVDAALLQNLAGELFDALPDRLPFAAGGPSDVAGRIVARGLSDVLGQQVVVENPAGAGGTIGSLRVAKAPPDGYQFVIGNIGTHTWSQALYRKPPYNARTDFTAL